MGERLATEAAIRAEEERKAAEAAAIAEEQLELDVQFMVSMGFELQSVREALTTARGKKECAIEYLITGRLPQAEEERLGAEAAAKAEEEERKAAEAAAKAEEERLAAE